MEGHPVVTGETYLGCEDSSTGVGVMFRDPSVCVRFGSGMRVQPKATGENLPEWRTLPRFGGFQTLPATTVFSDWGVGSTSCGLGPSVNAETASTAPTTMRRPGIQ